MAIESNFPSGDKPKSKWRSGRSSFLISVLTHLLIAIALLGFGAFTVSQSTSDTLRPGGIVLTQADTESETEYLTETDFAKLDTTPTDSTEATSAQSASAMPAPELDTPEPLDLPGIAPPTIEMDANSMTDVPTFSAEAVKYELSPEDLKQIAKDRAFFESQRQLIAAVDGLEDNHEFQIVAYHDSTIVISERKMLTATEDNKQRVGPFFENVGAFGATNHYYGLLVGLGFKPDVLMFMTDGGSPNLTPAEIKRVREMAGGKTSIHCIEFGSGGLQQATSFMKKIALQNQGSYRYIDVNTWRSGGR